jgi:PAS domain-containing protein
MEIYPASVSSNNAPAPYPMLSFTELLLNSSAQVEVLQRPNQKFDIGHVDSSCALLLCDLQLPDAPIVYCSEPFEALTGYTAGEILGRNCRFLQAPGGKVTQGVPRKHTDNRTVYELKTKINAKEEVQMEILNYKKDGEPFINVLTTVPITYGSGCMRYMVGFQVDRSTRYIKNG